MFHQGIMKIVDQLLGTPLCAVLPSPRGILIDSDLTSFLIIRPGGIGDAVLIIPTVMALKRARPACTIDILAERRNASAFHLVTGINNVYLYDSLAGFSGILHSRYDIVIDTEQSHQLSAVVARLIRSSIKIGFDTNERRRMFTHCVRYDPGAYEADNFLALLKPLGIDCQMDAGTVTLSVPLQSVFKAHQLLHPLSSESFITLFPGASKVEKRWGADRFRRVAEQLSAFGLRIVVVGGKEDHRQGELITGGGLGLNLAGLTSLSETAAVIQKSALLVSGDSGVLHIAVGLGVPTVSLFGPGMAKKWAPQGDRHIVINKGLPCSPCTMFGTTPPCPNDTRCMSNITVDEVVNAVTMLLTSVGATPSKCCKRDWIETA